MKKQINKGFTLIEVLISIAIFAIVFVSMGILLRSLIKASEKTKTFDKKIDEILIAQSIIKNDLQNAVGCKITYKNKEISDANFKTIFNKENSNNLEFTREITIDESENGITKKLVRVGYYTENNSLYRYEINDFFTKEKRRILSNVEKIAYEFYDSKHIKYSIWDEKQQGDNLPSVININYYISHYGQVNISLMLFGTNYA